MSLSQLAVWSSSACAKAYQVDIILMDGAPWFRACEVTKILGYKNSCDALKKQVKDRYKSTKDALAASLRSASGTLYPSSETLHAPHDPAVYISEPGVYSLTMRNKMKEAENFQNWVVETVLPEIRAQGSYNSRKPQTKLQLCLINEFDLHAKVIDFIRRFHDDANIVPGLGENQVTEKMRIESWQKGYTRGQCDILLAPAQEVHRTGHRAQKSGGLGGLVSRPEELPGAATESRLPHPGVQRLRRDRRADPRLF